jgi:hypothetical protein
MNAPSPALLHDLARPVPGDEVGGADSRPDYIAAIEAAMNRPVERPFQHPAKLRESAYSGKPSALVARLQSRRAAVQDAAPARPVAQPLPPLVLRPSVPVARQSALSGLALGPITVTLPPQSLGVKAPPRAPVEPPQMISAAERLLLALTAEDTFIFKT